MSAPATEATGPALTIRCTCGRLLAKIVGDTATVRMGKYGFVANNLREITCGKCGRTWRPACDVLDTEAVTNG